MAQVTESLIREFQRAIADGKHAPMTIGEEQQLCWAWLKLNDLPYEIEEDDSASGVLG